jgi:PPK2 family polyphosphate:nucleotide phosphotransferase
MDLTDDMVERFRVAPGKTVHLAEWDTKWDPPLGLEDLNKEALKKQASEFVEQRTRELAELQELLWVDRRYSLLLIFQGIDASGKDSTIRHITSGMSPAGVRVISFKEPSREEYRRHYLWRYLVALPEQGYIGVFNRSYYEEVTVVRAHPELLGLRAMPQRKPTEPFWHERYEEISSMEKQLERNGTVILKFFLHISKNEQRKQLLQRLEDPTKQWKFSPKDISERDKWDDYQEAYEQAISNTSTKWAPWWIMPADRKWAMRTIVAQVVLNTMRKLDLRYPPLERDERKAIKHALESLRKEK